VSWCVQGNGSGSMLRSLTQAGAADFGSKSKTELLEFGFGCANKKGSVWQWGSSWAGSYQEAGAGALCVHSQRWGWRFSG
jgi:hypothetical protein